MRNSPPHFHASPRATSTTTTTTMLGIDTTSCRRLRLYWQRSRLTVVVMLVVIGLLASTIRWTNEDRDRSNVLARAGNGRASPTFQLVNISFFSRDELVEDDDILGQQPNLVGPKIAWLMSFPNSGTSFTSKMIRHASEMSTASNYGEENRDLHGNSVPVYPNVTHGPFWIDPHSMDSTERPSNYVLTKTHCGGRCEKCGPSRYVENPHSFLVQCLSGRRGYTKHGKPVAEMVTYSPSLVRKAVHLIRNPFDNVVSRFHLEHHSYRKHNDTDKLQRFPSTREGFRNFCRALDARYAKEEAHSRLVDPHVLATMKKVPCHGDFFRFVQWHNLAFVTTQDLGIPTMVLHYERYDSSYKETARELMEFLEAENKGDLISFIKGKEYQEYFTLEERRIVRNAVKELTLTPTWENLKHYFE